MKTFISKLMAALASKKYTIQTFSDSCQYQPKEREVVDFEAIETIITQLAPEAHDNCCEWRYDGFEEVWETSCGTAFTLHDDDKEVTHHCPYCGKLIKIQEMLNQ